MKITSAQFISSAYGQLELPTDPRPGIAFLGRSNVGKSSAINSLLKRSSLARTSSTPGRTRGLQFYLINEAFYFVDFPGYGYANVPEKMRQSWKSLIEAYLRGRHHLVLGILILDARHEPKPLDVQMYQWLVHARLPRIVMLTKADKLSRHQIKPSAQTVQQIFPLAEVIPFSATTRLGVQDVWRAIRRQLVGHSNQACGRQRAG